MTDIKKNYTPRRNVNIEPEPAPVRDAREDRAAEVSRHRRRREDSYEGAEMKLGVPDYEKNPLYVYRWINDDGSRITQMTQADDWDICTVDEFSADFRNTGNGTQISRIVGRDYTGRPMRALLCKKLKEYDDFDRAKEQERIDRLYFQMRQGELPFDKGLSGENPNLRYVPREARG